MKKGVPIFDAKPRNSTLFSIWTILNPVTASLFSAAAAHSQPALDSAVASTISIVPRLTVTETFTDNVFLTSTGRRAELITQLSPGINIRSRGGRITGFLDYSLNELLYARNSSGRRSQNSLNAFGTVEVIEKTGYVDFSGVISQQAVSAFGSPVNDGILLNQNSTETSVFRLSPYIRGRIAGVAEYDARYSLTSSRSKSAEASDVDSKDLSVRLNGVGGRLGLGWSVDASQQDVDYNAGRSTQSQRVSGQLSYALNTNLSAYVKGAYESNNFFDANARNDTFTAVGATWTPNDETRLSIDQDSRGFTGLVASWTPSRRTSISATRQRQLYGDTHSVVLSYRTPKTAWTFSDSRGVVASPGLSAGAVSLYDVLAGQFAAAESDPVKRGQYDDFLLANGIKPGATAVGGFLTSSVSLQRQQQLSFALFGARNTLSVVATRGSSTKLDTVSTAQDDFSTSAVIVQNGLSVNYSHRFTAKSVLIVSAAQQNSSGSLGQQGTSSRSFNVNLSTDLSRETSASLSARRVVFDSGTAPYTENAIIGNLNVRF